MKLHFLGRGASFYPQAGNNSAYFIDHDELFLIDSGEDVFAKLLDKALLKNITKVNLMITHLHSDHVGSLGSLILYCFYTMRTKLNIVVADNLKYMDDLKKLIQIYGCSDELVEYRDVDSYEGYDLFDKIEYLETMHTDRLDCYGIKFTKANIVTYYSGDTKEITQVKDILENYQVDYVYVDVNSGNFPNRVHLYIGELLELDHKYFKDIYCMHINSKECIDLVKEYGLNLVEIE